MALKKKLSVNRFNLSRIRQFGHILFALGILLVAFFTYENSPNNLKPWHAIVLLAAGLLVGLVDVKKEQAVPFLLSFLVIIITSNAPLEVITYYSIGPYLKSFLTNTAVFLTLAVVTVSGKVIYRIYRDSGK